MITRKTRLYHQSYRSKRDYLHDSHQSVQQCSPIAHCDPICIESRTQRRRFGTTRTTGLCANWYIAATLRPTPALPLHHHNHTSKSVPPGHCPSRHCAFFWILSSFGFSIIPFRTRTSPHYDAQPYKTFSFLHPPDPSQLIRRDCNSSQKAYIPGSFKSNLLRRQSVRATLQLETTTLHTSLTPRQKHTYIPLWAIVYNDVKLINILHAQRYHFMPKANAISAVSVHLHYMCDERPK